MAAALPTDAAGLEAFFHASIPLTAAQGLTVTALSPTTVELRAPLAPNVNDKGCAFGGSIAGLLTLAQWGLVNLKLGEAGLDADVFVADTSLRFLAPVWGELHAEAYVDGDPWPDFLESLTTIGKARIEVHGEIVGEDGGAPAAKQSARFVAIARRGDGGG